MSRRAALACPPPSPVEGGMRQIRPRGWVAYVPTYRKRKGLNMRRIQASPGVRSAIPALRLSSLARACAPVRAVLCENEGGFVRY